ncbi:group II intron maturase-specific domain-containing protein [Vibrio parahaemolyticus]|uniref:group II intron maturase-specific domain-containing protein n=1 Tax=Vibrio parahaemolyticus TaxID=670 RepID=UPI0022365E9D|nr:group II intron maturase-specific domain-containing protein [Vibrio parahaemolyticus]
MNYYRHCVAKQTFGYVAYQMFLALWRCSIRHHPNKGRKWIAHKYFLNYQVQWVFHDCFNKDGVPRLFQIAQVPIKCNRYRISDICELAIQIKVKESCP